MKTICPRPQQPHFRRLRLLDLDDHVGPAVDLLRPGDQFGARGERIPDRSIPSPIRPRSRPGRGDPSGHFLNPHRQQTDAIFVRLYFLGHANDHDEAPAGKCKKKGGHSSPRNVNPKAAEAQGRECSDACGGTGSDQRLSVRTALDRTLAEPAAPSATCSWSCLLRQIAVDLQDAGCSCPSSLAAIRYIGRRCAERSLDFLAGQGERWTRCLANQCRVGFGLSGPLGKDSGVCRRLLPSLPALVDGQLLGRGDLMIDGAAPLCDAQPGQITLVDGGEKNQNLAACRAAAVIAPRSFTPTGLPAIQVARRPSRVRRGGGLLPPGRRPAPHRRQPPGLRQPHGQTGRATLTFIRWPPSATTLSIGAGTTIHGGVHIMAGSRIGENVTIFPNAVLYENTVVGPRCLIHAGAVLGAYGFGYELVDGRHQLSAQLGNVELGADVEIGAGTTIDRGTYGPTVVGEGTKIDDLVMIAHNCRIGRHNMLCSQVGIAGSTTTGDYVVMAGPSGRPRPRPHRASGPCSGRWPGVINDVPDGSRMIGIPATPEREQKIKQALMSRLPEMRQQLKQLQAAVEASSCKTPKPKVG